MGAGQTLLHQYLTPTGDTYWVQMQMNPVLTAGTTVTINDTAPTKDRFNLSICALLVARLELRPGASRGTVSPVAGGSRATITLSGAASATAIADANGNYTFAGLTNGSYIVTPSKTGYNFSPANQAITINGTNQNAVIFTAQLIATTWSISGSISPAADGSGATVTLSGSSNASTVADANGNYSFNQLANGAYTVTPSSTGFTFTPVSQPVTLNNANITAINFAAQAVATVILKPIQKNVNGDESTASGISASFTAPNTAGDFLLVSGTIARPAGTLSISDTLGKYLHSCHHAGHRLESERDLVPMVCAELPGWNE